MTYIVERVFNPPLNKAQFKKTAEAGAGCFDIYRVSWHVSLLSEDGSRLVCAFEAPDAEAVRSVTRADNIAEKLVWAGGLKKARPELTPTVVVERNFTTVADLDELQAREDANIHCLETHQVTFVETLFREDTQRMICLYHARDAESVRTAQRMAGMPFDKVWACHTFRSFDDIENF